MGTHRIAYGLVLVLAALFFVLSPHWFAWYFLVLSLIVLPFDIAISLPGMLTRRLSISAPYTLEQGSKDYFVITVQSSSRFPSGPLRIPLKVKDNDNAYKRRMKCSGTPGSRVGVEIDTTHSGVTSINIRRFWASSILGLVSIPIPVKRGAATLILPTPVKPPGAVTLPQIITLRPKPGGGYSEEHDLRPYREGDQIRTVHWKLSAKHDSLIVREALAPPSHSRLLHAAKWKEPKDRDLILGRLRWLSDYLLEMELPHYVKFGENYRVEEISRSDDLINCFFSTLDNTFRGARVSAYAGGRFTWVYRVDATGG